MTVRNRIPPKVLVVDDDPRVLVLSRTILERSGYDVVCAATCESALDAVSAHADIAVAIVDVVMPGMSGYDLAAEFRRLRPATAVVFMSGFRAHVVRQPVTDLVVPKPFSVDALVSAVAAALRS
ncbi:MAG TPA: response regulator [Vicinamibacterales bacterium]|nr:response regulator [Vicinamibacterales bacterium]